MRALKKQINPIAKFSHTPSGLKFEFTLITITIFFFLAQFFKNEIPGLLRTFQDIFELFQDTLENIQGHFKDISKI